MKNTSDLQHLWRAVSSLSKCLNSCPRFHNKILSRKALELILFYKRTHRFTALFRRRVLSPKKDGVDFRKSVKYLWILYKGNKNADFDQCFSGCFILGLILMMIRLRAFSVPVCKKALYPLPFYLFARIRKRKSGKKAFALSLLLIIFHKFLLFQYEYEYFATQE